MLLHTELRILWNSHAVSHLCCYTSSESLNIQLKHHFQENLPKLRAHTLHKHTHQFPLEFHMPRSYHCYSIYLTT